MPTTMMDIARHCGLSRPTVNLVLSGRTENLRPATVERVRLAAAELGYHPNAAARAMRRGRFMTIALVASAGRGTSAMPAATLASLADRLAIDRHHLLLVRTPDESFTAPGHLPQVATEHCADAMILDRIIPPASPVGEAIESIGTPAVWWNVERPTDAVRPDDEGAGRRAVAELLGLGHRRIAYLNPYYTTHISETDRRRGYEAAMAAAGLVADSRFASDPAHSAAGEPDVLAWLVAWLRRADRPTAIIANETITVSALREAAAAAGLAVPGDLSIVAIGSSAGTEWGRQTSLVHVPEAALGIQLAEMALQSIAAPKTHQPTRRLPFDWLPRGTTAPSP